MKVEALLTDRGTTRSSTTAATGDYIFSAMPIGVYEVRFSAPRFQQFLRTSVTLDANQNVRADAGLTVGSVTGSVNVTAESPLVDNRSAVMGTLIDDRRPPEFNALNRVNLGNPNVPLGSSMGRITSAGSPRVPQFALKLLF